MKIYESVGTYVPFFYFLVMTYIIGLCYHHPTLTHYKPYTILTAVVLNTLVYMNCNTKLLIHHVLHIHIWKTTVISLYGISLYYLQLLTFQDFTFDSDLINISTSIVYIFSIWSAIYLEKSNYSLTTIHLIFAFFPLHQGWMINSYCFLVYTTCGVILQYANCTLNDMLDNKKYMYMMPIIKYYQYLRVDDYTVWLGIMQLLWEHVVFTVIPEAKAMEEVQRMLADDDADDV